MTLIYIYEYFRHDKVISENLEKEKLLIPPIIVNNQPWSRGYFETIGNVPVTESEKKLEFAFWDVLRKEYVDIHGKAVKNKPEYCGIYGLGSYGVVGKDVQKALQKKNDKV